MFSFDRHRRVRDGLSPYIDGQLSPPEKQALEFHLESCDACRRELDELRAVSIALRQLPQAQPSRSFTVTPQQVQTPAGGAVPAVPALAAGVRFAGAALAFALALVLVVDLGNVGSGGRDIAEQDRTAEQAEAPQGVQAADESRGEVAPEAATEFGAADTAARSPSPTPPVGAAFGGVEATASPQPTASPVVSAQDSDSATAAAAAETDADRGISALRIIEITLALALAVTVVAAGAFAFFSRGKGLRLPWN